MLRHARAPVTRLTLGRPSSERIRVLAAERRDHVPPARTRRGAAGVRRWLLGAGSSSGRDRWCTAVARARAHGERAWPYALYFRTPRATAYRIAGASPESDVDANMLSSTARWLLFAGPTPRTTSYGVCHLYRAAVGEGCVRVVQPAGGPAPRGARSHRPWGDGARARRNGPPVSGISSGSSPPRFELPQSCVSASISTRVADDPRL